MPLVVLRFDVSSTTHLGIYIRYIMMLLCAQMDNKPLVNLTGGNLMQCRHSSIGKYPHMGTSTPIE
jgi:hypothetical protein